MRFYINTDKFITALQPANIVATKNVDREWNYADKITIDSNADGITVLAYQRDTFIVTDISEDNCYGLGYLCLEEGSVTVNVIDFINTLRSFPTFGNIIVCGSEEGLRITSSSDEDEFQTVLSFDEYIPSPDIASGFKSDFTMDREVFINGIKKVSFAMGEFETQSYYMCLLLEASKNKVRFAAGSGARFAIHDVEGKRVTSAFESASIIFPKYAIIMLSSILHKASITKMTIKQTEIVNGGINQMVLELENSKIIISNLDASINYPPLDKIINYDYPYKISTKTSDWQQVTAGIAATNTKQVKRENDLIISNVTANLVRGYFAVDTITTVSSSSRKVCFSGNTLVVDESVEKEHKPYFRCNALYLQEMIDSSCNGRNELTIHFEDKPVDENIKQKPIVIEYPEVTNKSEGTKEKFYMFFRASKI